MIYRGFICLSIKLLLLSVVRNFEFWISIFDVFMFSFHL